MLTPLTRGLSYASFVADLELGIPPLSCLASSGASSTPQPIGARTDVSGILDRPLSRAMTPQ